MRKAKRDPFIYKQTVNENPENSVIMKKQKRRKNKPKVNSSLNDFVFPIINRRMIVCTKWRSTERGIDREEQIKHDDMTPRYILMIRCSVRTRK